MGVSQAYSRLSTTHGYITDCKLGFGGVWRCRCCDLMWTCLVWAERSTPEIFWVPSHRFNSATCEQKGITQTIYTDSKPPSRMPNSLMPSAKLRNANLKFLLLWCDAVGDRTPSSCTRSGRSNHCATRGRGDPMGVKMSKCYSFLLQLLLNQPFSACSLRQSLQKLPIGIFTCFF